MDFQAMACLIPDLFLLQTLDINKTRQGSPLITNPQPTSFTALSEEKKEKEKNHLTCDTGHVTPDT